MNIDGGESRLADADSAGKASLTSAALLVIVNLIPIAGVLFGGWDVFVVLALFWAENLIIGGFAILRLLLVERRLFAPAFFTVHFGGFCFGHGTLLVHLFGPPDIAARADSVAVLANALAGPATVATIVALIASHGWSFATNTLARREFANLTAATAMRLPYQRIIITQVALILGAAVLDYFGEPLFGLIVLVIVKTLFDLRGHRREHNALTNSELPRGI